MTAVEEWATALRSWAIPDEILQSAPESPWCFPVGMFTEAAREAMDQDKTATHRRVAEATPKGGVLLDVGSGAGAASLPVAPPSGRVIAVDQDRRMLDAVQAFASAHHKNSAADKEPRLRVDLVEGLWPDVAGDVEPADVVVCANVAYNVADIGPFLEALTLHARHRVVVELTAVHPQSPLSPLWKRFWGLDRPDRPTAQDFESVVHEVTGARPSSEHWKPSRFLSHVDHDEHVAWLRRRLCLTTDRDTEVEDAIAELPDLHTMTMVTMWWPGSAT